MKNTPEKKAEYLKALEECLGNITVATRKVGLSRECVYAWSRKDLEFAEKCAAVGEIAIDFVESKLMMNIKNGDTTAILFYLKTKGKKRGYVERSEVDLKTLPPIIFEGELPADEKI